MKSFPRTIVAVIHAAENTAEWTYLDRPIDLDELNSYPGDFHNKAKAVRLLRSITRNRGQIRASNSFELIDKLCDLRNEKDCRLFFYSLMKWESI